MFGLLFYAWTSAVVTGLLGTLPGRSFRFRTTLVGLVLSVSVVLTFSVSRFLVEPAFVAEELPDNVIPGDWAMLGLHAKVFTQLLGYILMVAVAYFLRRKLLPPEQGDTTTRSILLLAAVSAIVLVVTIPLALDGNLLRLFRLAAKLLL